MKVLLLGYYGHQNFGDDLLMKLSLDHLRQHSGITSLGVTCDESGISYVREMVPYVDRVEPIQNRRSYLGHYDRVIFGGGGTVFEYRANLSVLYLLRKKISDYLDYGSAKRSGAKFASIGLGIGPFADTRATTIAMNRLSYHDLLYVRDSTSLQHAKEAGLEAQLSHDLSFLDFDSINQVRRSNNEINDRQFCFIVRNFKYGESKNLYLSILLKIAEDLKTEGNTVKWLSFQKGYDMPVVDQIREAGHEVWTWDPETMKISEAYQLIGDCCCVVTARMHGTYVAGMLGVPTVSIGLHPKLKFASNYFSNSIAVSANPTFNELSTAINRSFLAKKKPNESELTASKEARDGLKQMLAQLDNWIGSQANLQANRLS